MKLKIFLKALAAIVICQLAGVIGSFATIKSVSTWYVDLQKPALNPPSWVFGPVWIMLYALMGIALFLVWQKREKKGATLGLVIFGVQLALNSLWSILFFGLQQPFYAFCEIVLLWVAILLTTIQFYKIDKKAFYLLLPYLVWVGFAAYLNYSLWQLNI